MGAARAARTPPRLRDSIGDDDRRSPAQTPAAHGSVASRISGLRPPPTALSTPLRRPEQRFPGEGGIGLKAEQSPKARVTPTERTA